MVRSLCRAPTHSEAGDMPHAYDGGEIEDPLMYRASPSMHSCQAAKLPRRQRGVNISWSFAFSLTARPGLRADHMRTCVPFDALKGKKEGRKEGRKDKSLELREHARVQSTSAVPVRQTSRSAMPR